MRVIQLLQSARSIALFYSALKTTRKFPRMNSAFDRLGVPSRRLFIAKEIASRLFYPYIALQVDVTRTRGSIKSLSVTRVIPIADKFQETVTDTGKPASGDRFAERPNQKCSTH